MSEAARPTSTEDAVELFLAGRRRGDDTDPVEFAAQHPQLGPELASALSALLALESVTQDRGPQPERVGPYRVVREVGRGGMGVVLEAVEEALNRRVALKVLPAELLSSASARARFRREAELAARFDHPGIATVYGTGVDAGRPWIAMRYVEGRNLAHYIAEARAQELGCVRFLDASGFRARERTAPLEIARRVAQIARALHAAHERSIVHRDVKPSNVIIALDDTPVLVDFGLAIADEPDGHALTRTGETAGTPAFLAPEIVSGERARPDVQTDVYALGVTLFECLTLRRPFDAPTPVALFRAIASESAPDARAVNRDVPRDLAVVVATALERDRARRYRSAAAFADDLEACAEGRPIAARPVPYYGRALRWARREPRQALLASLLGIATLCAAVLGGTWWAERDIVYAAELVAREQDRDRALVDGYTKLLASEGADDDFVRALALDPESLEALAGRALARIGYQRDEEALRILASAPRSPGFDALRAFASREAITQDVDVLLRPDASSLDFFMIGVGLYLQSPSRQVMRRLEYQRRAVTMLNEAVVRSRHARSFFYVVRARVAGEAGDERSARSAAGALLALWPDSFHALTTAGTTLSPYDPAIARAALERAAAMEPDQAAPLHELGALCRLTGDFEGCEAYMWRALRIEPHPEIFNTLGVSLAMRGCFDEAGAAWQQTLALDPRHVDALLNSGQLQMQSGDMRAALPFFVRLLAVDPLNPGVHAYRGIALREIGDARAGCDHLAHSVALDGNRPDIWHELAVSYQRVGERDAALATIDAALELHPAFQPLAALRARMLAQGE
ncbi:MAG: protein kinase domain-containing protein [Planctomycetota bacterium]